MSERPPVPHSVGPTCVICGQRLGYLERVNQKGVAGIWACPEHIQEALQLDIVKFVSGAMP